MIVGLCGWARTGKDAIAAALGWPRAAFADALKADLAPLLKDFPNAPKETIRPLFVEYGRTMRKLDPDYWLKRILIPRPQAVITDVRYLNEARMILDLGGKVVRLYRPGVMPANEEEQDSLAKIDCALSLPSLMNNGTIEQAKEKLLQIIEA